MRRVPAAADQRPELASACRQYAEAWSLYVQWDYSRRLLAPDDAARASMESHFRRRLMVAGRALRTALAAVWPEAPGTGETVDTPLTNA